MSRSNRLRRAARVRTTLFELVAAVGDAAESDPETVTVVEHWLSHASLCVLRTAGARAGGKEERSCSPSFA